jgi:thiamine biosynthesis lipoprotein
VPGGLRLDLNGVVKSRTVDDALALIAGTGFVSAGGDLAARGGAVVALPRGGAVRLLRGGLATSGRDRRRWQRGGQVQHHLIDPRTGRPSESPWEQVTVCGSTCLGGDVAAKAAFLMGYAGVVWLDALGLPGRFVEPDGSVRANRSWARSLEGELACT